MNRLNNILYEFQNISGSSVYEILPLAVEYQIEDTKAQCEDYLEKHPTVKHLVLAEKYDLNKLHNSCLEMMKNVTLENLQAQPEYELLSRENVETLLVHKYKELERKTKEDFVRYQALLKNNKELKDEYVRVTAEKHRVMVENRENKGLLSEVANELQYYRYAFFCRKTCSGKVLSQLVSHQQNCNFTNAPITNPGANMWSKSYQCDYCFCKKLQKILGDE